MKALDPIRDKKQTDRILDVERHLSKARIHLEKALERSERVTYSTTRDRLELWLDRLSELESQFYADVLKRTGKRMGRLGLDG